MVPYLLNDGHFVRSIDVNWFGNYLKPHEKLEVINCDIRNITNKHLKDIDAIIHLANIANNPAVELEPQLSWEINVLASQSLATKAIKSGLKRLSLQAREVFME